jgi:hypothetical protein
VSRLAADVIGRIEGVTEVESPVRHRPRRSECPGGVYYGHHYFNPSETAGNAPNYQLTKGAAEGYVRFGGDLFSVWYTTLRGLRTMVGRPIRYFLGWEGHCYVFLTEDTSDGGPVAVFYANRGEFARRLAAASGTSAVWSCSALASGSDPWR